MSQEGAICAHESGTKLYHTSAGKLCPGKISVAAVDDPSYSPSLTQSSSLPSVIVPCLGHVISTTGVTSRGLTGRALIADALATSGPVRVKAIVKMRHWLRGSVTVFGAQPQRFPYLSTLKCSLDVSNEPCTKGMGHAITHAAFVNPPSRKSLNLVLTSHKTLVT